VACVNPVLHYNLDLGLVREGDDASLILVNNLREFKVLETWIGGQLVARHGESLIMPREVPMAIPNHFECNMLENTDFLFPAGTDLRYEWPVIEAADGQLITGKGQGQPILQSSPDGFLVNQRSAATAPLAAWCADPTQDLLKIVVVNRYRKAPVAKGFIRNFGLKQGALASSVAHDSHNIVCVGVDDESMCRAVNGVIRHRGGISCVKDNLDMVLPLPVAGLMSQEDGYKVAELYTLIDQAAKDAGSTLQAPFMTLSFMALLVIPHLKISDLGLFDGDRFELLS
jgi:adenine deaminase